jgi:hypothetical protein
MITRRVDEDAPHPGLEVSRATVGLPTPDRDPERLLDDVESHLAVTRDGCGDAAKLLKATPIHGLELLERAPLLRFRLFTICLYDVPQH